MTGLAGHAGHIGHVGHRSIQVKKGMGNRKKTLKYHDLAVIAVWSILLFIQYIFFHALYPMHCIPWILFYANCIHILFVKILWWRTLWSQPYRVWPAWNTVMQSYSANSFNTHRLTFSEKSRTFIAHYCNSAMKHS